MDAPKSKINAEAVRCQVANVWNIFIFQGGQSHFVRLKQPLDLFFGGSVKGVYVVIKTKMPQNDFFPLKLKMGACWLKLWKRRWKELGNPSFSGTLPDGWKTSFYVLVPGLCLKLGNLPQNVWNIRKHFCLQITWKYLKMTVEIWGCTRCTRQFMWYFITFRYF